MREATHPSAARGACVGLLFVLLVALGPPLELRFPRLPNRPWSVSSLPPVRLLFQNIPMRPLSATMREGQDEKRDSSFCKAQDPCQMFASAIFARGKATGHCTIRLLKAVITDQQEISSPRDA